MSKGKVSRILLWDAGIVAVISLSLGLFSGVVLSKLFELGLVRLLRGTVSYRLFLSWDAMKQTLSVYLVIFSLIFLNGLRQVRLANPVTLLRSESAGEKPPRRTGSWVWREL